MHLLAESSVRMISSSQVITSIYCVVKELIENSIDASATSVDIKLEDHGLKKIEVRDNGIGIEPTEIQFMAKPHYTSKIVDVSDLESLKTYGFRGEALSSLCSLADVTVVTRTADQEFSSTCALDRYGNIVSEKASYHSVGTTVTALNIFSQIPVRRQFFSSVKNRKAEIRRSLEIVTMYSLACPWLRLTLWHNQDILWQKNATNSLKDAIIMVYGAKTFSFMHHLTAFEQNLQVKMEMYIPKCDCRQPQLFKATNDRTFFFVNRRPVTLKKFASATRSIICQHASFDCSSWPACTIFFEIQPSKLDVNVDPNKHSVMIHDMTEVLKFYEEQLENYYSSTNSINGEKVEKHNNNSQQKTDRMIGSCYDFGAETRAGKDLIVGKVCNAEDKKASTPTDSLYPTRAEVSSRNVTDGEQLTPINNASPLLQTLQKDFDMAAAMEFLPSQDKTEGLLELSVANCELIEDAVEEVISQAAPSDIFDCAWDDDVDDDIIMLADLPGAGIGAKTMALSPLSTQNDVSLETAEQSSKEVIDEEISELSWSRGHAAVKGGKTFGPAVLAGRARPSKDDSSQISFLQPSIVDAIATPKRPCAGFVMFSRKVRPALIRQASKNGWRLEDVAKMIQEQWEELDEHEKKSYEENRDSDTLIPIAGKVVKEDVREPFLNLSTSKMKRKFEESAQEAVNQMFSSAKKKPKVNRPKRCFNFCMKKLKEQFEKNIPNQTSDSSEFLIGIVGSFAIFCANDQISIFSPQRAQESLLFRQLMLYHALSTKTIEPPIMLHKVLSPAQLSSIKMFKKVPLQFPESHNYLNDPRLTKNGFNIKEMGVELSITAMSPLVDVHVLKEILQKVEVNQEIELLSCRPTKIVHILQGEAVRMARQLSDTFFADEVLEIRKKSMEELGENAHTCFHSRPFLVELFHLNNPRSSMFT